MQLPHMILRGVQALFAIIVLGTAAYVASVYDSDLFCDFGYCYSSYVPSQIAYIIFCSVWTLLVVIVLGLVPLCVASVEHPIVMLALDGLTTLLWFAGAIALAVFTGVFAGGPTWYQVLQACVAFAFFTWLAFLAAFILDIMAFLKGGSHRSAAAHHNDQNPELQQTTV